MDNKDERDMPTDLIIVHIRLPSFDYVGRISEKDLELDKPFIELYQPVTFAVAEKQGQVVPLCGNLSKVGFWADAPIYLPRHTVVILRVKIGGRLWNAYRNAIGEKIQVHQTMPPGMQPPQGSMH